jgi:hypothetical protein
MELYITDPVLLSELKCADPEADLQKALVAIWNYPDTVVFDTGILPLDLYEDLHS